jgi:hypothetical protein
MKTRPFLVLFVSAVLAAACRSPQVAQLRGTDWKTDTDQERPVTYVSPEEYDRMSESERRRLNASMGFEARWSPKKPEGEAVSAADLDRARRK